MEDKPADEPAKPQEEEEVEKKKKGKEKQDEEEEQAVYSDASDELEEDGNEEYMDALEPKPVDALRSEKSKTRRKKKAKRKKQKPKPIKAVPQIIPPAFGIGDWWPSAEEWHLAVVNARWKDEMERLGVPYPTAHMSMAQLDEWRVFFQTMFDCEPWEYQRLMFDSDGFSISDDDDPMLSD